MSVGPGPHPALVQGNQSTLGPDPSQHSALFYLFQEVSKLPSLIHNTVVGTDPPCPWLKDASLQGRFNAGIKGREMRSSEISDHSGSPHKTNVTDQSQDSETTPESHSPWRVLSLINLQCKRLLHHSDAEEYGPNSSLPSSTLTIERLTKTAAKVTDQEVGSDRSSSAFGFRPSVLQYQKEEIASRASAGEAIIGTGVGSNPQVCETESREDSGQSESTGEPQTGKDSSHFHHKEDKEDKFSTNRQSGWNGEQVEEYVSSEEGSEHLTSENISKKPKPTPPEFLHDHLAFGSNVEAVIFLMRPEFTLDRNANVSLPIEAARDPRLQSLHASQPSSPSAARHPRLIPEQGPSPVGQSGSPQEVTGSLPVHQISDTPTNPAKRGESRPELGPGQKKDAAGAGSQPWRTRASRKQPHPVRSVDIHDPHLQGVMFRMDPELDDSKEQCRLLITSEYRGCYNPLSTHGPGPSKRVRKPRPRIRTSQRSVTTSSSDDETSSVSKDKICASCCTRKTPMWRNAEDGTALCNACGIRYKKYKVRCVNCWHIPRKESNSNSTCLKCGNFVRLTSAQLKHTT